MIEAAPPAVPGEKIEARLQALLDAQRAAFLGEAPVPAELRIDRLERAAKLLIDHEQEFIDALATDFGQRPGVLTRFADIVPPVRALQYARKHVRRWMRVQRILPELPWLLSGARTQVRYQPLGVVGLISPWNFPVNLTFCPLAGVLAAGNHCLIKPSELTPATSALMERLIADAFDAAEVSVVTGDAQVAEAFSGLPFDHLVFTGSSAVGRRVMARAAEHLVPVTLELGGKCPTVLGRSADLASSIDRILLGKLLNAGQMCLAPDYVYVPRGMVEPFIRESERWVARVYPGLPGNADYTSLVSERHASRLAELLADARAKGGRVIELGAAADALAGRQRLMRPALIVVANDDIRAMQEEIFGPVLPLRVYDRIEDVIEDINGRPRPLALYYFGTDPGEQRQLLDRTTSGGVTINDVAMHVMVERLPFGGIGASGMGAYHGVHGFRRFSHARAIYRQPRIDIAGLAGLRPPYGARIERVLRWIIRR
jgi:coniferyl-aldehyde dehydrogenase